MEFHHGGPQKGKSKAAERFPGGGRTLAGGKGHVLGTTLDAPKPPAKRPRDPKKAAAAAAAARLQESAGAGVAPPPVLVTPTADPPRPPGAAAKKPRTAAAAQTVIDLTQDD